MPGKIYGFSSYREWFWFNSKVVAAGVFLKSDFSLLYRYNFACSSLIIKGQPVHTHFPQTKTRISTRCYVIDVKAAWLSERHSCECFAKARQTKKFNVINWIFCLLSPNWDNKSLSQQCSAFNIRLSCHLPYGKQYFVLPCFATII